MPCSRHRRCRAGMRRNCSAKTNRGSRYCWHHGMPVAQRHFQKEHPMPLFSLPSVGPPCTAICATGTAPRCISKAVPMARTIIATQIKIASSSMRAVVHWPSTAAITTLITHRTWQAGPCRRARTTPLLSMTGRDRRRVRLLRRARSRSLKVLRWAILLPAMQPARMAVRCVKRCVQSSMVGPIKSSCSINWNHQYHGAGNGISMLWNACCRTRPAGSRFKMGR